MPRGRPKKKIDLDKVQSMASFACTQDEIAKECGFERTLFSIREDVKEAFQTGFNKAKTRLRVAQFKAAEEGNTSLLIWLGKQYLDQKEPTNQNDAVITEVPRVVVTLAGVEGTVKGEKDE